MEQLFKKILRYFRDGVFVIVPFVATIMLVFYPLNILSKWVTSFINIFFRYFLTKAEADRDGNAFVFLLERYLTPSTMERLDSIARIPYINLLCIATLITFFGALASDIYIQGGVKLIEKIIIKIPGISLLYSYAKESTAAFVGKFNKPVLVKISKVSNVHKIGFITQEHVRNLPIKSKEKAKKEHVGGLQVYSGRIGVYIPHSYAFSGELIFVKRENVKQLSITSTEAWKIILSGGIAEAKQRVSA